MAPMGRLLVPGRLELLSSGNITVVKMVHVKTGVAPDVSGEVGIATVVVVAEAEVRKPVNGDGVNGSVEKSPVDTLEAAPGRTQLTSVQSPVNIPGVVTAVAIGRAA